MDGWNQGPPKGEINVNQGESMRAYQMLVPVLALAMSAPAAAQNQVPAGLRSLRPHQIVEAVAAEQQTLDLTAAQQHRLDSLHLAIRSEPHRYVASPGPGKAHQNLRMRPMISRQRAYAKALAILTPDQRARATARFGAADYRLPAGLQAGTADARRLAADPLGHHIADNTPVSQSAKSIEAAKDPLQHHFGQAPAVQDAGASPANPMTHR